MGKDYNELLELYSKLTLSEKREEFNKELTSLCTLVKMLLEQYNVGYDFNNYNYKSDDIDKTEDEILTLNLNNLLELRYNILLLLSLQNKNDD